MRFIWIICSLIWLPVTQAFAEQLTVDAFSRDRVLFDVGAAFGRNSADIPVTGTGQSGNAVEARWVNDRTDVAGVWTAMGQVDSGGRWSGSLALDARADWFRLEARSPAGQVAATTRFGTGDVAAIFGQSEFERLWASYFSDREAMPFPPLTSDQVQFTLQGARGGLVQTFAGADATHAMNAMAAFWIANAPQGRKLHVVDLTQSGTSRSQLQNDGDDRRNWGDLENTVAALSVDGVNIGLILESWFAGDRGTGTQWAERFMPLYTGVNLQGRDFQRGAPDSKGVPVDHFLWDVSGGQEGLFVVGQTALGIFGPHRFDSNVPLIGATVKLDGKVEFGMRGIERARAGVAAFQAAPQLKGILVDVALPQPLDYANGFVDATTGAFSDSTHPSYATPDGQQRLAKHTANAALVGFGHLRYAIPAFDRIQWRGEALELSSSAGPITTARRARGLPPLGTAQPHWTDVLGFEINGRAAQRAEVTPDGKVLIYPNPGKAITSGDVVSFGMGGGGGFMRPAQDWAAAAYLNYPVVDFGLDGLEGVALSAGMSVTVK